MPSKLNVLFSVLMIYISMCRGFLKFKPWLVFQIHLFLLKKLTNYQLLLFWQSILSGFLEIQCQHSFLTIKSFKSQKHNISIIMTEVATVLNNTSTKEDSAWLIQWVIDNKLVCYIILHF